jgi:phosphatidylinositol glycan class Q protein
MVNQKYTIDDLTSIMLWLMKWPAGLKLNAELGHFLSTLFFWMIYSWQLAITEIVHYLPTILFFIGASGIFGATITISLLCDMFNFLILHIRMLYIISARIYNWNLLVIDSTFKLFRGKRRNPLRNRIDNVEYELDQLLLGAIIFTLLIFLLPTVAVYYYLFCTVMFG